VFTRFAIRNIGPQLRLGGAGLLLALLFAADATAQQARLIVTVVDYINNAPIAGAQIRVFRIQRGWTQKSILIARKKTPKSGVVVFEVEPLADYEIRVTRGGPLPYPIETHPPAGDIGILVRLPPDLLPIDRPPNPMIVRPPNPGVPRTPFGVLTGRVMSANGTPLPRLTVDAISTADPGTRSSGTTGPDGRYRIEVRPGSYMVKSSEGVVAPHELRNASTYELHGAAESPPVVVNARTQVAVDLWLPTTAILYNATITVLDDAGQPAKDAEVEVFWKRDPLTPNGTGANSLGLFHTKGEPVVLGPTLPGPITVVARSLSGAVPLAGITQFDLQAASRKVRVLMRAAARVSGRVEFDGREIPVQGVNGLRVMFLPLGSAPHYSSTTPTIEADGAFTLNGLIGEGCLRVDGLPGGWRVQGISQNGDDLTDRLFTLDPGDVKSDIVVRVEIGEPPKWRIPTCK